MTCSYRLTYGRDGRNRDLEGYADADKMSVENHKAILGYTFLVDSGTVSWSLK